MLPECCECGGFPANLAVAAEVAPEGAQGALKVIRVVDEARQGALAKPQPTVRTDNNFSEPARGSEKFFGF